MKNVLVLGAGMISKPMIAYLLNQPDFFVTMASRTVSKAENIIHNHPQGKAFELDVNNDKELEDFIIKADIVVSLLPYNYHFKVAEICVKHKKHLVTTSYVSDSMRGLDKKAKDAGVILLNECGLDPGIDHMSAMRVIHRAIENGGKIINFRSTTGALPAHESNNNPFGYKFSWSPRGVLLASKNAARWLEDGKEVFIPGELLFENYSMQDVPSVGTFENYPNRNSIPYKKIYELNDAKTVYRGTFRMHGWCETFRKIVALGWLNDKPIDGFSGKTYADLTRYLIGAKIDDDLISKTAKYLDLETYSTVIKRFEWLGLFSNELLPNDKDNPLDYLNILALKKMSMGMSDKDMIIMHHEFIVEYSSEKEYITSTLVDYGIPGGNTSIARTVSLPAAIAVKMIIKDEIKLSGVQIPVVQEIYNPILNELEEMGIKFSEKIQKL